VSEVFTTCEALPREVIDQRQYAEAPAVHQYVGDELERPAQIAILRNGHRRQGAESPLAPPALAHGEPIRLAVNLRDKRLRANVCATTRQPVRRLPFKSKVQA
jgi:hypothetical protein